MMSAGQIDGGKRRNWVLIEGFFQGVLCMGS